jgi:hypothetical protein
MADPTLEVLSPRKRGRPRARDPLTPITVWISAREQARIQTLADRRGGSVSSTARLLLKSYGGVTDRRE